MDPDPAIFVIDVHDAKFFCFLLFEGGNRCVNIIDASQEKYTFEVQLAY